jgi:hypothetical protein
MNPALHPDLVREAALVAGVCARPVVARVTDNDTGEVRVVPIACGSTRQERCPPCAEAARRLRMQQCREGWHLDTEPEHAPPDNDDDEGEGQGDERDGDRRVRSTRRRQDVPDLPRLPVVDRTVGRVFTTPDGKTYRPSMFATLTLPSYGRVTAEGVPVDPDRYDYRRAALDALHFPKLVDRFWQNLRRCAGYQVQYFATIEPQRRLAPHLHAAIRGTIPRRIMRQVRAATYHQLWWPAHDQPTYVERLPRWSDETGGYVDPETGALLPTWDQALDALDTDPDAVPAHVVRFGEQDDLQGLLGGTAEAESRVGYLCKYLTKDIAHTYDPDDTDLTPARAAHIDRVAEEVRWLPCSHLCELAALRHPTQERGAGGGARPVQAQGPRPGQPRSRRPARARVPQVVRQDAHRTPRRPGRRRPGRARRGRHRPRRPRRAVDHRQRRSLDVGAARPLPRGRAHLRRRHRRTDHHAPAVAGAVRDRQGSPRRPSSTGRRRRRSQFDH